MNNFLTHACNAIVLFIDIFIHAHPPKIGHVVYPLTFGMIYTIFSIAYTVLGGTDRDGNNYIYSVLNWINHPLDSAIFAFLVILFLSFVHLVLTFLITLRIKIHERLIEEKSTSDDRKNAAAENRAFEA